MSLQEELAKYETFYQSTWDAMIQDICTFEPSVADLNYYDKVLKYYKSETERVKTLIQQETQ